MDQMINKMEINKSEAIVELEKLKKQMEVLEAVINAPAKQTAKEWLVDYMKQEFTVKFTNGFITYYLGEQWTFRLELKNYKLMCHYYTVWRYLETKYDMKYEDIPQLVTDVVGTTLNCNDFRSEFLGGFFH